MQLVGILLFLLLTYILLCFTLAPLFRRAGSDPKKAWIPGVNFGEWAFITGRKRTYAWWLLFPIVNFFIYAIMAIDMVRAYGKLSFWDSALAVIYAPLAFFLIDRQNKTYQGKVVQLERQYREQIKEAEDAGDKLKAQRLADKNPYRKGPMREWVESLIFAVFAAAFIRMFLIEAFIIPTSSMEGSLKVGDFLFVSKINYGIRTPMTIAMVPLLHNRISALNRESYLEKPSLPYFRLPALESIERHDNVVFNYPEGDSVVLTPGRTFSVYDLRRRGMLDRVTEQSIITRPMDKMDHYIKRTVGLPGEDLEIRAGTVYINNEAIQHPEKVQFTYRVTSSMGDINVQTLDKLGVHINDHPRAGDHYYNLSFDQVEAIQNLGSDIQVSYVKPSHIPGALYPHNEDLFPGWTTDDYGPIHIPSRGETIDLTPENVAMYRRVIEAYEGHSLKKNGDQILIDGSPASQYTFKYDYYWMMGDNRHNSEDSRFWGFVPETHVVGKPLFIWMSLKNSRLADGIRWDRIFNSANKK